MLGCQKIRRHQEADSDKSKSFFGLTENDTLSRFALACVPGHLLGFIQVQAALTSDDSELLLERADFEFRRPGTAILMGQMPVCLGDGLRLEHVFLR